MKILLVEDEMELVKSIVAYLEKEHYTCDTAGNFKEAMQKTESFDYDCILLDISLPGGSGLQVLAELKNNNKADGVIIISARDSVEDRITGLNTGADDYLPKPFHLSELSARIAAVIRRRRFNGQGSFAIHEFTFDTQANIVLVYGKPVDLTKTEYDLLLYFATNKNRVVAKNAIAERIAGTEVELYDNYDFLYAHIKNLKKKLAAAGAADYIKVVYNMGYKFDV